MRASVLLWPFELVAAFVINTSAHVARLSTPMGFTASLASAPRADILVILLPTTSLPGHFVLLRCRTCVSRLAALGRMASARMGSLSCRGSGEDHRCGILSFAPFPFTGFSDSRGSFPSRRCIEEDSKIRISGHAVPFCLDGGGDVWSVGFG